MQAKMISSFTVKKTLKFLNDKLKNNLRLDPDNYSKIIPKKRLNLKFNLLNLF